MKIEILFYSASAPKICKNVDTVYTKGGLLCVQYKDRLIVKYPLLNIFSVAHYHGNHLGSTQCKPTPKKS